MQPGHFPLGTIIAERRITLYDQRGEERAITVRLGSPVGVRLLDGIPLGPDDPEASTFRCPVQIAGLDHDENVYAPFGEDPFIALQYALDLIGDLLKTVAIVCGLRTGICCLHQHEIIGFGAILPDVMPQFCPLAAG